MMRAQLGKSLLVLGLVGLGFPLFRCSAQSAERARRIRVDPELAGGGPLSRFIDNVQFIPLERRKECQVRSIFQVETTGGYIVFLDKAVGAVFVFTQEGLFRARVNIGPTVFGFSLDGHKDEISIDEYPDTKVYNLEGKLVRQTVIGLRPHNELGVSRRTLAPGCTAYVNTNLVTGPDSLIYSLLVYKDGRLSGRYLPYPADYRLDQWDQVGPINFATGPDAVDSGVYYMRNYDYTVYRLTPSVLRPAYQFIFPLQESVPGDFMTDTGYNGRRTAFFSKKENGDCIRRLYHFSRVGDMLFFSEGRHSYVLDTRQQVLVGVNRLIPDSLSFFLPLTDSQTDSLKKEVYLNAGGVDAWFQCSPAGLLEGWKVNRNKKVLYPAALEKYFNEGGPVTDRNPVLVRVRFKSSFQ